MSFWPHHPAQRVSRAVWIHTAPLAHVIMERENPHVSLTGDADAAGLVKFESVQEFPGQQVNLHITAGGYVPLDVVPQLVSDGNIELTVPLVTLPPAPVFVIPPAIARAALPAVPPGTYDHVLTQTIPGKDKRWYRGNFCGVRVPGAPPVLGGYNNTEPDKNKDLMMALLLRLYPAEWQDEFLKTNCRRGYTHLQQSVFADQPVDQFVAQCKASQHYGLFSDVWFNTGDHHNQGIDAYRAQWDPLIDALLANKAIDTACVGWQLAELNDPLQTIIDYLADRLGPHDIPLSVHFNPGYVWCGQTPSFPDRFAWWRHQQDKLTGMHYQCVPIWMWKPAGSTDANYWSIPEAQARLCDTLNPAADGRMGSTFGRPFSLDAFEQTANRQFFDQQEGPDNHPMSEDDGDLVSYLLLCTQAATPVMGFGNGARYPDGRVI